MWKYEKRLQYPVKISQPNPDLAQYIISQYGGPDGEMSASMRYLSQRFAMPYKIAKGTLTDIGSGASEMCKTAAPLYDRRCGCQKGIFRLVPKAL
ncbi:MAG: spore coat protein CotJC [Lachnospiraceae bacterium]|nr:spore coat protein CotJC [Lachnospiraceae bacterium]